MLASPSQAAWEIREPADYEPDIEFQIAYTENDSGQTLEVVRRTNDRIVLRLLLGSTFTKFNSDACPTLQFDNSSPTDRFVPGQNCELTDREVEFDLGLIIDREIESPALDRLANRKTVYFRYVTTAGEYREVRFGLAGSKEAIRHAIGTTVRFGRDN